MISDYLLHENCKKLVSASVDSARPSIPVAFEVCTISLNMWKIITPI